MNERNRKKISVIIPAYNLGEYLKKSLDSVLNQTFSSMDFEIIIANDCSTDDTLEIIQDYASRFENVLYFDCPVNGGPGISRNHALDMACGDFIFFLDGDDTLAQNALEKAWNAATSHKADVVSYDYNMVEKVGGPSYASRKDFEQITNDKELLLSRFLSAEMDGSVIFSFIKRSLISENNISFPAGLHEDIPFIFEVYFFARNIFKLEEILYYKTFRKNSIVNTMSARHIEGVMNAWSNNLSFLRKNAPEKAEIFLPAYTRGLVGCVGGFLEKNSIINARNADARMNMCRHLFEYLVKNRNLEGLKLPQETRKDLHCLNFYKSFCAQSNTQDAFQTYEEWVKNEGALSEGTFASGQFHK